MAEEAADVGIQYDVQVVSTDKLYDLTVREENGKPAPDYDTFIWGWGGDPYDPSFLLGILTTGRDRRARPTRSTRTPPTTGSTSSRPGSSTPARKEIIQRMVALTQRDLPYLC